MSKNNENNTSTKLSAGLVPKLRFPEFENDGAWEAKALGEIANRITEKVHTEKLTTVSISAGVGFVSQAEKFSRDISGQQYKNYIFIRKGDFAYNKGYSKTFPQGSIYRLKEYDEAAASTAFICFRFKDIVVADFYKGYFEKNSHGKQLKKFITSGARMDGLLNISPTDFFSIILPTPKEKPEQQKIAACLSSLDEVITAESQKLELLQQHKKGLLQNLLPKSLNHDFYDEEMNMMQNHENQKINKISGSDNVPKLRFKEFEDSGEWEVKRLGEIGEFIGGGTPSKANETYWQGNIPWISSSDFLEDDIHNVSITRYITEEAVKESATKIIPKNSVLFVSRVGVGKLAINKVDLCTSQDTTSFVPIKNVSNYFIGYYFLANKNILKSLTQGTSIKGFTKSDLENFKLLLPPTIKEQQKIAACLSSLDDLINAQTQKIELLQQHKKGLLQGLFPNVNEITK